MTKRPHVSRTTRRDDYETPRALFDVLNKTFDFNLDAAASASNAKCDRYFDGSVLLDALNSNWAFHMNARVWCNPPFSQKEAFLERAMCFRQECSVIVFLLPNNSRETGWWMSYARRADQIINLVPRVNFLLDGKPPVNANTGKPSGAGFSCCLLVFYPRVKGAEYPEPNEVYFNWKGE